MSSDRPRTPTSDGDGPLARALRLSAATSVVGVIGYPISHSLSPLLHNTAFAEMGLDWVSVGFPVPPGQAARALIGARAMGIRGLSVTMPHKEEAAQASDRCTTEADRLHAVNCLINEEDGWLGDNTDGAGLLAALARSSRFDPSGRRCMVVGAGGAARAVIAALGDGGASEVIVVNRTAARGQSAAALAGPSGRVGTTAEASSCALVVNATPVGMDDVDSGSPVWPVDPGLLGPGQLVVDLVYHPPVTPWLAAAAGQGSITSNGLGMLVHQAALQIERWTGTTAPVDAMWAAVEGG